MRVRRARAPEREDVPLRADRLRPERVAFDALTFVPCKIVSMPDPITPTLSHLDDQGRAKMVDVGSKQVTAREATAEAYVLMAPATLRAIAEDRIAKGEVLAVARVAGIMAAKRTSELIPLCHPLALSKVTLDIEPDRKLPGCDVRATVKVTGPTGVEMEALTAVSVACLTIYDMIKAAERGVRIEGIHLVEKQGGKSGHYQAST